MKHKYICDGKYFVNLWAAKDWAQKVFQRTGNIVAIEEI